MKSRRTFCQALAACTVASASGLARGSFLFPGEDFSAPASYLDGRPATTLRMDATDSGPILRHGSGPNRCDTLGAREAICFKAGDTYYLHYDGAGPKGWLACLATSKDLHHWDLKGPILDFGAPGERDSASASSPWTVFDGEWWHMFYVGCQKTSPPPALIPSTPYYTLAAKSRHPDGPWISRSRWSLFCPSRARTILKSPAPARL
jgi:hypothetical protein